MLRTREADCVRNRDWQSKNAPGRRKIADISASGSVATGRRSLARRMRSLARRMRRLAAVILTAARALISPKTASKKI